MPRKILAVSAFLAVLAGLAGCSAGQPVGTGHGVALHPAPAVGSAVLTRSALDLLTKSGGWGSGQRALDRADDELTRSCLRKAGFDYPLGPVTTPRTSDDEVAVVDLATRRRYGYQVTQHAPVPTPAPADRYVAGLSASDQALFRRALFGPDGAIGVVELPGGQGIQVHTQGCEARSRARLAGDLAEWELVQHLPEQLNDQLTTRVLKSREYLATLARWRTCMAGSGYPYPSPEAAHQDIVDRYARSTVVPGLAARERAVATADGECALRLHLIASAVTDRRALASGLPAADRRGLVDAATRWTSAVQKATNVLHDAG